MPGLPAEQAKAVIHVVLTLLRGQFAVLAQFPGQVRTGLRILWGLTLVCGLRVPSEFRVTLGVNLTHQVSLVGDLSLPLPVAVIDGLHELMEVQQRDGSVVVHHLIFDVMGQSFVGLPEKGVVIPL